MDQDVKLSVRQIVRILLSSDDVRHFEKIFYFSNGKEQILNRVLQQLNVHQVFKYLSECDKNIIAKSTMETICDFIHIEKLKTSQDILGKFEDFPDMSDTIDSTDLVTTILKFASDGKVFVRKDIDQLLNCRKTKSQVILKEMWYENLIEIFGEGKATRYRISHQSNQI